MLIGKDEYVEEIKFMKNRSVFKHYIESTPDIFRKMFDVDLEFWKVARVMKNSEDDYENVKQLMFDQYERILNIFLYYSSISDYPVISWNDFTSFSNKVSYTLSI